MPGQTVLPIVSSFYVELDCLRTLLISNRNLVQLFEKVGWVNDVMFEENVYPNLVKVFYSNMDTFAETQNRIITHVGGVKIEFYVSVLNEILGTPNKGLEIYSVRKAPCL